MASFAILDARGNSHTEVPMDVRDSLLYFALKRYIDIDCICIKSEQQLLWDIRFSFDLFEPCPDSADVIGPFIALRCSRCQVPAPTHRIMCCRSLQSSSDQSGCESRRLSSSSYRGTLARIYCIRLESRPSSLSSSSRKTIPVGAPLTASNRESPLVYKAHAAHRQG